MEIVKRLGWLVGALLVSLLLMFFISRYVTRRKAVLKHLVLEGEQDKDKGYVAVPSPSALPKIGEEGVAYSPLRPSGKVLVHGKLYDAQAENFYVEKDRVVVVIGHEGGKITVRAKETN